MPSNDKVKKQIKFAVVMYGGGSLAIYINGVAQELLKLAQATNDSTEVFEGTTLIYRKIALLMSGNYEAVKEIEEQQEELVNLSKEAKTLGKKVIVQLKETELNEKIKAEKPSVDFILDVLTGSSAGGINAVFLSKALINGAQNMDDLQALWLEQGDFAKLLNDKQSVADNSLNAPHKPESLLNSQRMYLELLKALDGLDSKSNKNLACVRDSELLDLYVTYTDFEGLPTNLVLADKTVLERVHKRVFNFRHAPGKNDFGSENNPFLAFAARCTSSFPIAFEPMRLKEIDGIIDAALPKYASGNSDCPRWMQYFSELTDENGNPIDWKNRWFVDGGCLDNKPFGYAIDKLSQRTGEGIVERKLLYIEPNPESFRNLKNQGRKPNALENVFGQASGLPSYETIREDLQRVLDRNRLIERVARITAEVENDFDKNPEWFAGKDNQDIDWSTADLENVAKLKGASFIPYYRLRVSSTTDEIARLVTRYFKIDDNSDYFNALRSLIRSWRELNYHEYKGFEKETFNKFLYQYDVEYRLRRLRFIMQKAESMLRCKDEILTNISGYQVSGGKLSKRQKTYQQAANKMIDIKQGVLSPEAALIAAMPDEENKRESSATGFSSKNFINAVIEMQREFSRIYLHLRRETEFLKENLSNTEFDKPPFSGHEILMSPDTLKLFQDNLKSVEKELSELERKKSGQANSFAALERILTYINRLKRDGCTDSAKLEGANILKEVYDSEIDLNPLTTALESAATVLNDEIFNKDGSFLRRASGKAKRLLGIEDSRNNKSTATQTNNASDDAVFDASTPEAKFVQAYLRNYYELFDSYDQISYPLFFESPVGEAVKVDVVRVSSRDASSLIDEDNDPQNRRKLAGDYLFAFGAFLDPRWRLNDIMWGRLDGAERLITTLLNREAFSDLSDEKFNTMRDTLIEEANRSIIYEVLMKKAQDGFQETLVDSLTLASTEAIQQQAVDKLVLGLKTPVVQVDLTDALTTAMTAAFDEEMVCNHFREHYVVNRRLEPQPTLKMISRSTQIIGKILQDITDDQVQMGNRLSWIGKLGQIFWGLVTVAAPNSIWNLLFNYWIQLLYLFEVMVIVGATIFANQGLQQFGIIALIVTLGIHLTVISLEEVMLGNNFWKTLLRFLVGSVLAIFVVGGAVFFYSVFFDPDVWKSIDTFRTWIAKPEFERWHKLIPFVPFAMVFIILALWREAEKLNLKLIGRALIISFLAVGVLDAYFKTLTGATSEYAPILELEFISNGTALTALVNKLSGTLIEVTGTALDGMRIALWLDTLAFVPLYWGFLLILSGLLNRRRQKWASAAAIVAALAASAGVIADLVENYYSLVGLKIKDAAATQRIAENITFAAEFKWTLVFLSIGILSTIFLRFRWSNIWNLAGVLLLIGAISGIIGVFVYPFKVIFGMELITASLLLELIILVAAGIAFQFRYLQQTFLRGY